MKKIVLVTECRICRVESENVTHLDIFVTGSEGVTVCMACRQTLTEVVRGMMRANTTGSIRGYKAAKQVAEAKNSQMTTPPNQARTL